MIRQTALNYVLRHPFAMDILKNIFSSKSLINNKLYKKYTLKKAMDYASKYPYGNMGVAIETTLNCNSRCIMCYHSVKRLSGTMSMELFKKIINDCHNTRITRISLSVYGEPLMDKYFFERIKHLRQSKFNMTYTFNTNGYLLTGNKARELFELGGLKRINFSVNGHDSQVYEKIMSGLRRDTTYRNILHFLDLKDRFKQNDVMVGISAVKLNLNKKDMRRFVKFWQTQKGVDYVLTADLRERIGDKGVNEIGKLGKMSAKNNWSTPCQQLYGDVYIYYDGTVAPCCDDNDLRELIVGDMNKQTLADIYTSRHFQNLRKLHLDNKRNNHEICGRCSYNSVWLLPV